jgi:hypothetical protein
VVAQVCNRYDQIVVLIITSLMRRETRFGEFGTWGAGALGFRDFPGLLVMKENRTGNHRTLHTHHGARSLCNDPFVSFPTKYRGKESYM